MGTTNKADHMPLSGITVVELGNIVAGPFASLVLADLGADVIKVEHPDRGDIIRTTGETGEAMFPALNRNKRSAALDLKSDDGREAFLALIDEADVVVENLGPNAVERLDLGYETLQERNPGLVYLSIKGFLDGPYGDRPGMDMVAEAMSGLMSMTGEPDRKPVRVGTSIADMGAALYGVLGVLLALWDRERTGEGQSVDGTLFEASAHWMGYWAAYADRFDRDHPSLGASHPSWALYDVFETREGEWLFVGITTERHWPAFCRATVMEDLLVDERFETASARRENQDELTNIVGDRLRRRDREALLDSLFDEGVPAAPVNNPSDLVDDPHLDAVDLLTRVKPQTDNSDRGLATVLTPVRGDRIKTSQRRDPPAVGEHTADVLEAYLDDDHVDRLLERLKGEGTK